MANWKSKAIGQVVSARPLVGCLAGPEEAGKAMLASGVDSEAHEVARQALLARDLDAALAAAADEDAVWALYVRAATNWLRRRWMRSVSSAVKGLGIPASSPADAHYQKLLKQIETQFTASTQRLMAARPKPRLSVCVITKNEERSLERCLKSVKAVADEIVVVDTGSTDDTLPIARRLGAKVGHFDWVDDFSAARNAALDLANGDWILSIDADEWLDESSAIPIRISMSDPSCRFMPIVRNAGGGRSFANTRLFPRDGARWRGRLHEDVRFEQDIEHVRLSALLLHHDGRDPGVADIAAKAARNRRVLAAMAEAGEETSENLQIFEALIAATAEPDAEETIAKLRAATEVAAPLRTNMGRLVMMILTQSLVQRERFDEALEVADLAERHRMHGLWSYYLRSRCAYMRGRNAEAHEYAKLGLATFDDEGPVERFRADLTTILEATQ